MWFGGISAHAQTAKEVEPNNTKETAQIIQANKETAIQSVDGGIRVNQFIVDGSISNTDEDWYKVYLSEGTQYVTCNGDRFDFQVLDADQNLLLSEQYLKNGFGVTAYSFMVPTEGYYYVRLTGVLSSSTQYFLFVGGPTYTVGSCTVNMGSIAMTGTDSSRVVDLTNTLQLPEDAVVYMMTMQHVGSVAVKGIEVRNVEKRNTVILDSYTWMKRKLASLNLPLKSNWNITFKYNTNITLNPVWNISFTYPITDRDLGLDNIVIQ